MSLVRLGYKVVGYNHTKATFVRLSENQPSDFRSKEVREPRKGQKTLDLEGLVQLMVPDDYEACDLRALIYKVLVMKTPLNVPMAYQKQYKFQLKKRIPFIKNRTSWELYSFESRFTTDSPAEAAKDLKVVYLSEDLLSAWKYSISKAESVQN
jgi:hypothetical protein